MNDDFLVPNDQKSNTDNAADNLDISESDFKTPEEAAQNEELQEPKEPPKTMNEKKGIFKKLNQKLSKKQKIILIILLIVCLAGLLGYAWVWKHKKAPASTASAPVAKKAEPKPTTEASKLTGLQVGFDVNKRPVTAVMIENSPDARPQAGLKEAGVVFEAVAEGGITRFLALFQDTEPGYIGPVRSARPYYVEWEKAFDAPYAHVGGSGDGLARIKELGVKDMDQFYNPAPYHRISTRFAPHNVYTSMGELRALETSKGWTSSDYTGFTRAKKEAPVATPTYKTIDVNLSGFLYNPHWDYDSASNSYLRSEGGKPHVDDKSGQQISAKVVVVMVTKVGLMGDGYHSLYQTGGTGPVYIFQNGEQLQGNWSKKDAGSQITFTDPAGKPIQLTPGATWITAVGDANNISAKP